jgi:hypothetical protein
MYIEKQNLQTTVYVNVIYKDVCCSFQYFKHVHVYTHVLALISIKNRRGIGCTTLFFSRSYTSSIL